MENIGITEEFLDLKQKFKNVNKLIKYHEGLELVPEEHKNRIMKNIKILENKVSNISLEQLKELRTELQTKIKLIETSEGKKTYLEHIQGWYFRPLLNHFDNAHKIETLTSSIEGAAALTQKLKIFIPEIYYNNESKKIIEEIQKYFKFKAFGKGSKDSFELQKKFYGLFQFNQDHPLQMTTLGYSQLPVIHYKMNEFWNRFDHGSDSALVTGLCPLSTMADELGFVLLGNKMVRPNLGFGKLLTEYNDIIDFDYPKRPILTDYVKLKLILELYKNFQNKSNLSVYIWYPYNEYFLDLTQHIFKNYLKDGIIQSNQITNILTELKIRYLKLIEYVKQDLGLLNKPHSENINIIVVNEEYFNKLNQLKQKVDLSFFKHIYGIWIAKELRHNLYEQLIIKHIKPVFDGVNVLHLDTSYELWVDILGSCIVERENLPGNYSFVNYASLPSLDLSHMREYNAPFDQKLYLSSNENQFKSQLDKLSQKYILHIAPLILDKNSVIKKQNKEIIKQFKTKLLSINEFLQI